MARLTDANVALARQIISRYPRSRSALVPLLHLAQEQDGWLTDDAMAHIGELLGLEPAEVLGTRASTRCSSAKRWAPTW
jgi:NADH-quinone oxidoreductase subunit E